MAAKNSYIGETDGRRDLVVTGDWTEDIALLLSSGSIQSLALNYARGFKERTLDFIDDWPITGLDILARTITSLGPIYRLKRSLKALAVQSSERSTSTCFSSPT